MNWANPMNVVRDTIAGTDSVASVHDIHLWAITYKQPLLAGHVVLAAGADGETVWLEIERRLQEGFDLHYTTLQGELSDLVYLCGRSAGRADER